MFYSARQLLFFLLLPGIHYAFSQAAKPFPQHVHYASGSIRPGHISQAAQDVQVINFYREWKVKYLKKVPSKNERYVWFESSTKNNASVSEGQGYGMMIVAIMAGTDRNAQLLFDQLYHYYINHPSRYSKYLMAWQQKSDFTNADTTSATDGDMDIAYSLLLANNQWGSKGKINYLEAAKQMIAAIMSLDINQRTYSILLSDALEPDSRDYFDMRSSDFMPSHFRSFRNVTKDLRWNNVISGNYTLFNQLQNKYSSSAGLIPDFIVQIDAISKPAPAHYLESKYDGMYNYNACRVPWRIGIDYLLNGDQHAATITHKINRWIRSTTSNNPDNISAGYTLQGDDLSSRHFEALSFIVPFAVSAMTETENQSWLNKLWDYILNFRLKDFDYYDNTIKLIGMIIMSGNYWAPK